MNPSHTSGSATIRIQAMVSRPAASVGHSAKESAPPPWCAATFALGVPRPSVIPVPSSRGQSRDRFMGRLLVDVLLSLDTRLLPI
ncbi:hypothetical protein D9M71_671310 [compost metagenome]